MVAIAWTDLAVGMQVTTTLAQTSTGAYTEHTDTVVSVDQYAMHLSSGAIIVRDPGSDATLTLDKVADPTVIIPAEPISGTIVTDETGAAWQGLTTITTGKSVWYSINGEQLTWADFYTAHPTYTTMKDSPVTPLPAPVSPYPAAIAPADVHSGMDIQATITYTAGGSKVVRGICVWVQDNNPGPDYLAMSLSTGDVFQYDPVPDGQTLTVEQMQAWTADATWPFVNVAEPAIGTIIRDAYGIAWQRITDAALDDPNPGVTPGKGRWFNVTQSITIREVTTALAPGKAIYTLPISWFWLWGVAAPFNVQEATP